MHAIQLNSLVKAYFRFFFILIQVRALHVTFIITNGILISSCFFCVSFLSHCPIINFDLFEKLRIVYPRNRFRNFVFFFSLLTFFIWASLMLFCRLNSCLAYIILILVSFYIYIPFYMNWLFWKCVQVLINFWIKKFFGKTKFPCRMFELI